MKITNVEADLVAARTRVAGPEYTSAKTHLVQQIVDQARTATGLPR